MERITLRIFFVCLVLCASIVITFIWIGDPEATWPFQIAATAFVFGLANFLTWFVCIAYRFIKTLG